MYFHFLPFIIISICYIYKALYQPHYLKGHPRCHITNEYLVPFVTGFTLCHTWEGKVTTVPFFCNSLQCLKLLTCLSLSKSEFLKSNSTSPPSYSVASFKDIMVESFLILP